MPTAIAPAFLGLGRFYERRRWRIQIRQYRYCLRPFLIRNHLQPNGFCSLRWECCHHQQRQQCPSHAPPDRWPTFSTTFVMAALFCHQSWQDQRTSLSVRLSGVSTSCRQTGMTNSLRLSYQCSKPTACCDEKFASNGNYLFFNNLSTICSSPTGRPP